VSASVDNPFLALAAPGISGLHPYVPGKPIEELERELGLSHTIKLASNENPLGPSPMGAGAASGVIDGVNLYPDDAGFRLRNALSKRFGVAPEAITLGSGSSDVIDMVARAFLAPGRNAVFARHSFAMYPIYTQAQGAGSRVAAPFPPDHARMPYGHDPSTLLDAVNAETRVLFIANPNNPTGTWMTRDELTGLLDRLPSHVVVVLDEAYIEYVEEPAFPNGLDLLPHYPNLIVTRTFSKIYGLAGLRIGYGISAPDLAAVINRVRHPFNVNSAALAAAEAALNDTAHLTRSREVNRAGLRQLSEGLASMGLRCIPSMANFITVDIGRSGSDVFESLLRKGVIVRPVANYDMPHHLRVTVGREAENRRFLEALAEVLER